MSLFLKSSFRHLKNSLIILSPVMFAPYLFFDLIGLNLDLILLIIRIQVACLLAIVTIESELLYQ